MIHKYHTIDLYVNGHKLDIESDDSLNIRFNNVLMDVEKIESAQGDYSYEFNIPATRNNNKIFDFANTLSTINKYHKRYDAVVYADSTPIFTGTLVINSYKDKKYSCNLVSVKTYSLDEIFSDLNLSQIPWYVPFSGVTSINEYNAYSNEVKFPLVSYGVFQKSPESSDEVANYYTSKFLIDKYNKWYVESFAPSLNMLETIKKAFEWKGYNVQGDAFSDYTLNKIYMSCNLDSDQTPSYNLGNPAFGKVDINVSFNSSGKTGYEQELDFPYFRVQSLTETEYNWSAVDVFDMLSMGTVTPIQSPCYMYQPNEHLIVIPADGFYKITLSASTTLNQTGNVTATTWTRSGSDLEQIETTEAVNLEKSTPVEIQLVRNYTDNIELIKGKWNIEYSEGNPNGTPTTWITCFPHEDPYNARIPTEKNDLSWVNKSRMGGRRNSDSAPDKTTNESGSTSDTSASGNFSGRRGGARTRGGTIDRDAGGRRWSESMYGYVYDDNYRLMMYDQAVSDSFICGMSSFYSGTCAVMRNGYSWSRSYNAKQDSFYKEDGYNMAYRPEGSSAITESATTYNKNTYIASPNVSYSKANKTMTGKLDCMVWLNKNDVISLNEVHRTIYYKTGTTKYNYNTTTNAHLTIEAASPYNMKALQEREFGYSSTTEFDTDLRLSNFLNSGTSITTFIESVTKAFNLQIIQNGNNIRIDKRQKYNQGETGIVDIDDRFATDDAESERINYPKSMSVQYKIDTEEWGFEQTVPPDKLEEPDWAKYGDSGFTKIMLNDDNYVTEENNIQTNFSYTYYDNFTWTKVDTGHTEDTGITTTLTIPVISKNTYMIDGYDYDEAMKHDGYSLTQRLWFEPVQQPYVDPQMHSLPTFVYTDTYPQEKVDIYTPLNQRNNINLSYKVEESSLLDYFNIRPYLSSNYVYVDVYLSPQEYDLLKNGGKVRFSSDLYDVVSMEGYDATGNNLTTIKMIKRV